MRYRYTQLTITSQDAHSTGILRIIPDIAHGVNSWQRTGQKIRVTKIVVQGHYLNNFSGQQLAGIFVGIWVPSILGFSVAIRQRRKARNKRISS